MRIRIARLIAFFASIVLLPPVYAMKGPPEPRSVLSSAAEADIIVVATISGYTQDPVLSAPPSDGMSPEGILYGSRQFEPGTYHLWSLLTIKGTTPAQFDAHLPLIAYYPYHAKFDLPKDTMVLLLLKKDAANQLVPVDPILPLIPLSAAAKIVPIARPDAKTPSPPDVLDVLAASMADKQLRPIMAKLFQHVEDPRMIAAMRPYADDEDLDIRSNVLCCLAVNQDVTAMPKIARLAVELEKKKLGSVAVLALTHYTKPEAIPYLNTLIAEGTDGVRQVAMEALRPLANESSIPYLIKALDRDDAQHIVASSALRLLRQLIPSQKSASPVDIKLWWIAEQTKAKQASTKPSTQAASQPATP